MDKTGRNAAHFFQEFFGAIRFVKFRPFFTKNFCGNFIYEDFVDKTGRNAAHFFPRIFWGNSICEISLIFRQ